MILGLKATAAEANKLFQASLVPGPGRRKAETATALWLSIILGNTEIPPRRGKRSSTTIRNDPVNFPRPTGTLGAKGPVPPQDRSGKSIKSGAGKVKVVQKLLTSAV